MISLCTEAGYVSLTKTGEQLCGDRVDIRSNENETILVLADGLGSGVKANILATLTAKILSTMIAGGMPVEECVDTMLRTLPVCKVRGIAYSTFSIIHVSGNRQVTLIQFDNPPIIVLREGKSWAYPTSSRILSGKTILESRFSAHENDLFIALSDGATYAGVGYELNYGWQRENIIQYAQAAYTPQISAQAMASEIAEACRDLYHNAPGDDASVAAVRVRRRYPVNLVIGPPADKSQDQAMLNLFFAKEGEKIICGGTTAALAADFLGKMLIPTSDYTDPEVPPVSRIEGVDLVTEGVVTISKVLGHAQQRAQGGIETWRGKKDGASMVAQALIDRATDINFFVGRAKNPAHQDLDLPISFAIKVQLVERLAELLLSIGKHVKISYF